MNYNVKTIEYVDSVQVRTYKRSVTVSNKINLPQPKQKHIPEPKERTQYQIEHSIKSSVNRTVNQIYTISSNCRRRGGRYGSTTYSGRENNI